MIMDYFKTAVNNVLDILYILSNHQTKYYLSFLS